MDFKDNILQIAERIEKQKDAIQTEEATKNAFIMPVIAALGYDIFNPFEVVPEMDCDLTRKGDKIDYAVMKDNQPILLIECKHCLQKLDLHSTQLSKYYAASNARFGVLTNGIEYRFYADLDKINIMDEKPFLVVNMLDLSDTDIEQMKKFHKSYFNESDILDTAQELKYSTEIKSILNSEFASPSYGFVRFLTKRVYTSGQVTQKTVELFTPIVRKSINTVINDIIQDRLDLAGKTIPAESSQMSSEEQQKVEELKQSNGAVTTQEEIDAYNIIRSILRSKFDAGSIIYKDFKSYFAIGFGNASYWWGCRLAFGSRKKNIYFPTDDYKSQERVEIETLDDIFKYADRLEQTFDMAQKSYENYKSKH